MENKDGKKDGLLNWISVDISRTLRFIKRMLGDEKQFIYLCYFYDLKFSTEVKLDSY